MTTAAAPASSSRRIPSKVAVKGDAEASRGWASSSPR